MQEKSRKKSRNTEFLHKHYFDNKKQESQRKDKKKKEKKKAGQPTKKKKKNHGKTQALTSQNRKLPGS